MAGVSALTKDELGSGVRVGVFGRRQTALVTVAFAAALGVVACGTVDPVDPADVSAQAWAAEIATAKQQATSDFERDVFVDEEITQAEYDEAVTRYVDCVNANVSPQFATFQANKDRYGMYSYQGPQLDDQTETLWDTEYDVADSKCRPGTIEFIEPIFVGKITNPLRQSVEEQWVSCLKRHDVVDATYTVANLRADLVAARGPNAVDGEVDQSKRTDLDVNSSAVNECLVTPWA